MLTRDERLLLREVSRWARDNGWERDLIGWSSPTKAGRLFVRVNTGGVDWWPGSDEPRPFGVIRVASAKAMFPGSTVRVHSVRQAVDVLVALDVLPAEFWSGGGTCERDERWGVRVTDRWGDTRDIWQPTERGARETCRAAISAKRRVLIRRTILTTPTVEVEATDG